MLPSVVGRLSLTVDWGLQIEWDDNEEFYRAWEEARTGYPWIDAIMTQLREQGWMHHLARHAVVSTYPSPHFQIQWKTCLALRSSLVA